jgi:hypothetical protein
MVALDFVLGGCRALIGTTPFELAGDGGSTSGGSTSSSQSTGSATNGSTGTPDGAAGDSPSEAVDGPPGDGGPGAPDDRDEGPSATDAAPDITVSGDGGITLVQATSTGPIASLTSVSVAFDMPLAAHDAIVIGVNYDSTSLPQITDSRNSNFQQAVSLFEDAGSPVTGVNAIWYALDVNGGADQVTVTIATASYSYFEVFIHEYAGLAGLDKTASEVGVGSTAMQTGFVTTTKAGDLIFAMGIDGTVSPGNGFTTETTSNGDITEDMIAGAPGRVQATAIAAGATWCLTMAAFRTF